MKTQILYLFLLIGVLFTTTASASMVVQKKQVDKDEIKVFPNPINEKGTIQFELIKAGPLKVEVFDLGGNKVKIIKEEWLETGTNKIEINAEEMKEGFYFLKIVSNDWEKTTRILIRR